MPSVLQILDSSSVLWIQKACLLKAHVENIILINILQNLIYIREYLANTHALVSWLWPHQNCDASSRTQSEPRAL